MAGKILSDRKVFFRINVDQGKHWGFGHFNRSSNLVEFFLKKKNFKVFLLLNDTKFTRKFFQKNTNKKLNIIYVKKKFSYDNIILNSKDIFIYDTLGKFKSNIFEKKRKIGFKIISLEDTTPTALNCDLVINSKVFLSKKNKKSKKIFNNTKFMVLNSYLKSYKKKTNQKIKNFTILISSGGSDFKNILIKLYKIIINISFIKILIIVGPGVKTNNEIMKIRNNNKTKIITKKTNLLKYYQSADLVISAGGTMMFEAMALGKIVVAYINYPHQKKIINFFEKKKCLIKLLHKQNTRKVSNFLKKIIANLKKDKNYYSQIQKNSQRYINLSGLDNTLNLIESRILKNSL